MAMVYESGKELPPKYKFMTKHREWDKLMEYIDSNPLWAILGTPDCKPEDAIMRAIHGEKAKNMSVRDTIDYCLKGDLTTNESITARNVRKLLETNEFLIKINEVVNVSLSRNILKYCTKYKGFLGGKLVEHEYADIVVQHRAKGGYESLF